MPSRKVRPMAAHKRGKKRRKTSAKTPATKPKPELLPQPHGGALRGGGKPGNRGGTGRPPSVIRERCRGSFEDRIVVLEEIADNPKASASDRIRALDLLGKYGLGIQQQHSGPDGGVIPLGVVELPMISQEGGDGS